jgi:hypothetical protein
MSAIMPMSSGLLPELLKIRILPKTSLAKVAKLFSRYGGKPARFNPGLRFPTWTLAIARFKAWAANRVRRRLSIDEGKVEQIQDIADNPEEALLKLNRGAILRASLALLSPEHREIIDLVFTTRRPPVKSRKSSRCGGILLRRECFMLGRRCRGLCLMR